MKTIFSFLFACVVGTTFGQSLIDFPYNPDSSGDGVIAVDDILQILAHYNTSWELPDPNDWASGTLISLLEFESELVDYQFELLGLSDSLAQVQTELDSVQLEIEACDRAEGLYNCSQLYGNSGPVVQSLPEDCGTVWTTRYGNGASRTIRLPPNAMPNSAILMVSEHQAGSSSQLRIEIMQNGVWHLLFSYGYEATGSTKYDLLRFDGQSWSREVLSRTDVPFD